MVEKKKRPLSPPYSFSFAALRQTQQPKLSIDQVIGYNVYPTVKLSPTKSKCVYLFSEREKQTGLLHSEWAGVKQLSLTDCRSACDTRH